MFSRWCVLLSLLGHALGGYAPSWEDFERDEAFVRETLNVTSEVPDRVSNLTPEVFMSYIHAGKPLIVTDMIKNWKMKDWTCDTVSKDFGEETVMFWSYESDGKSKKWHKLEDFHTWKHTVIPQPEHVTQDPEAPDKLAFHWYPVQMGVSDDEDPDPDRMEEGGDDYHSTLASAKARRKIKASYNLPYFVEKNPMNLEFTMERIEMFLSQKGAGAALHADGVCEPIFSVQLAGVKRWRLSPLPAFREAVQNRAASSEMQGGKGRLWKPTYSFDLNPGEAVFFPPSWMHETKSVSDECALSVSLQIRYPFPVGHIRDFSRRLVNSAECSFCFEHWAPFVTGYKDGVREMFREIDGGREPREVAAAFFDGLDGNGDGVATLEEKIAHFEAVIKQHRGQVEFMAKQEAIDWFVYSDANKDGKVTREEYIQMHVQLQAEYAAAINGGACDEQGCHPNVKADILAGRLSGIESAFISNNKYDTDADRDEV